MKDKNFETKPALLGIRRLENLPLPALARDGYEKLIADPGKQVSADCAALGTYKGVAAFEQDLEPRLE